MCLILNKKKRRISVLSVESVDMLPGSPESGTPEEGGN